MQIVRIYLRASTAEQNAERARETLQAFAADRDLRVVGTYVENASGARLDRPELFRLLADSESGDIMLVEQIDRLSRLSSDDWGRLRREIDARGVRVISLDLPMTWAMARDAEDEFTSRMFRALSDMMMDVLAAVARKDFEDRRRRSAQGIERARAAGKFKGRPEDVNRNRVIARLLGNGVSWSDIEKTADVSRSTIAKIARRLKESAA